MGDMSFFWWLAFVFFGCAVIVGGTILMREYMRKKSMDDYDFRREREYQQIAKERDRWLAAYEQERGIRIGYEATIQVQTTILASKKVADVGGRVGGKIGGRR